MVEAIFSSDRSALYRPVNLELEKLRVFLRLSHDRGLLGVEQLRYAIGEIDETGRMWHGWTGKSREESRKSL